MRMNLNQLIRTADLFATTPDFLPLPDAAAEWPLHPCFSISRQDPMRLIIANKTDIYQSPDRGANWYHIGLVPEEPRALMFDPLNHDIPYVATTRSRVKRLNREVLYQWISTDLSDGTNTWGIKLWIGGMAGSLIATGGVYLTIRYFRPDIMDFERRVWHSGDFGVTWADITRGIPNVPVNSIMCDVENMVDVLYVGTDIGVYRMANPPDPASVFQPYGDSLPNVQVFDVQKASGQGKTVLAAATFGRGVWVIQDPPP